MTKPLGTSPSHILAQSIGIDSRTNSIRRVPSKLDSITIPIAILLFGVAVGLYFFGFFTPILFYVILLAEGFLSLARLRESRIKHARWENLASLVVVLLALVSIGIPSDQLLTGSRVSILSRLGVVGLRPALDVPEVLGLAALAVCAFVLSECLFTRFVPTGKHIPKLNSARLAGPTAFYALLVVGVTITLLTPGRTQEALALRGQVQGDGLRTALADCLPAAISLGMLRNHWASKFCVGASTFGSVILLGFTQSRSPVLIILVALIIRVLKDRNRLRRVGLVVFSLAIIMYVSLVFITAFSVYRTAVLKGNDPSLASLVGPAVNPFGQAASVGSLDTADGLILSTRVDPVAVGATAFDPLIGVVNAIPSQVFPDKPGFLGPKISHQYTVFGGKAGLFLSGPGYFYVIWRGSVGVIVGFALLGMVAGVISTRVEQPGLGFCLWLYFLCRFVIGGDSFDILYIITVLTGFSLVTAPIYAWSVVFRKEGIRT